MTEAEGQPGAAASIVENMRGDLRVTPALASTTQLDFVHLVICRGGVVLLGEGNPSRVRGLIGQERKRLAKVIGSADLRDFMIGNDEGEVPIRKLRMTLMRLPRTLSRQGRQRPRQAAQGAQSPGRRCPRAPSPRTCARRRAPSKRNARPPRALSGATVPRPPGGTSRRP